MDVEKLIEGMKKRPILYESTKKAYKDAARYITYAVLVLWPVSNSQYRRITLAMPYFSSTNDVVHPEAPLMMPTCGTPIYMLFFLLLVFENHEKKSLPP